MTDRAVLLVGHGSHLNATSSAPIYQHSERIRCRGRYQEVRVAFWKEEPSLARALDGCDAGDVTVGPIFISAGYFTEQVIPREMRLTGKVTKVDGRTVRYTDPIGAHPALARVVLQRAEEAGACPSDALAVLGHGTPRNAHSERNVYSLAEEVAAIGKFPEVTTVFVDQEPNMRDVFDLVSSDSVVMVPLFVADGWHVGETIPGDMSLEAPQSHDAGKRLRYAAAVGTHPAVADMVDELVQEAWSW